MTAADQKCGKGNADDAVGLKCFPRDGPGRPQLHDKPIAVHPYVSIRRNVDLNSSSGTIADPIFGVDKTRLLDKPYALFWGIAIKPDNLASGLRQIETIRNEFAGYEIEFA